MQNRSTTTGRWILKRSNIKQLDRGTQIAVQPTPMANVSAPWAAEPFMQPTPQSDAALKKLFSPLVDVEQLYGNEKKLTGEQRLALALLDQAIDDARNLKPSHKFDREGARAWLRLRYTAIFSADDCCDALKIDYKSLRKRLELEWEAM